MNTLLILISVLLNCAAQIFIKQGMLQIGQITLSNLLSNLIPIVCNYWLLSAVFCYVSSFLMWIIVLSRVEVSYAYPFLSIGYVVATIAGYYLFNENITIIRFLGLIVICIGVFLISRS